MNAYELALAIILIVTIGSVIKSRQRGEREDRGPGRAAPGPDAKTAERIETLEERVAVLERIVTDRGYDIATQIEALRDTRETDAANAGIDTGVPLDFESKEKA